MSIPFLTPSSCHFSHLYFLSNSLTISFLLSFSSLLIYFLSLFTLSLLFLLLYFSTSSFPLSPHLSQLSPLLLLSQHLINLTENNSAAQ